jgi:hypothetical protein
MKKLRILFVLTIIALPLIIMSCEKSEEIKLDFDLTFPDNWVHYVYANEGFILDAQRIAVDESDTIREELVIFKNHMPEATLGIYFATLKPQIMQSPAYDSLLYDIDTTINETDFKKMLSIENFRYVNQNYLDTFYLPAITTRYFFYRNNYGYNMTFVSLSSEHVRSRVVFDSIMSSFHFKN